MARMYIGPKHYQWPEKEIETIHRRRKKNKIVFIYLHTDYMCIES